MADKSKKIKVLRFSEKLGFTTSSTRSSLMAKIKSTNTKPEILLRKQLWGKGIRYRVNVKNLPGKPDIVIRKRMLVIFVDGEFWHGYKWEEKKKKIKSNRKFWIPKIERNMQRDGENKMLLNKLGYKVLRFWEHEVNKDVEKCISRILKTG